jgi:hypothetical protein
MALTAAQLAILKRLHGEPYLKAVTHPEAQSAAIDEDVCATAIDMAVADFQRRGYPLSATDIEVLYYCVLFIVPRTQWSKELQDLHAEREQKYPMRGPGISGTALDEDDEDSRKKFSDDKLASLDDLRSRPGKGDIRGVV